MREEHPCPSWVVTGTICDACAKHGVGECTGVRLKRSALEIDIELKMQRIERGDHQFFNLREEKVLLATWRKEHPRPTNEPRNRGASA